MTTQELKNILLFLRKNKNVLSKIDQPITQKDFSFVRGVLNFLIQE